ncbi:MAG TPA: hypothetical protein DEB46_06215 [Myxococcales bacterium]|nr:hypothetical protein [Myxococcales bacterium]
MSADLESDVDGGDGRQRPGFTRRLLARPWIRRILGLLMVGFAVLLFVVWTFLFPVGRLDLTLNGSRYERVVKKARILTEDTTEFVWFNGDWDHDVAGFKGTNICAGRTERGELFVRILVIDRHRLGKYGYVYSEQAFATSQELVLALDFHGCGEWSVSGSLGGGWWAIKNNLG